MTHEIPLYIGKILVGGKTSGTGFVINARAKLVATARHVIGDIGPEHLGFQLSGTPNPIHVVRVIGSSSKLTEDIVLLELDLEESLLIRVPDLTVNAIPAVSSFVIIGFDQEFANTADARFEYRSSIGQVAGPTGSSGIQLFQLTSSHVWKGMSGAPVIVPEKGIIGMLVERGVGVMTGQALMVSIALFEQLDERIETARKQYLRTLIEDLTPHKGVLDVGEYVALSTRSFDVGEWAAESQEFKTVPDINELPSKFVILGGPGSGKTTTLRNLALSAAKNCLKDPDAPIPMLVELWKWRQESNFTGFLKTLTEQEIENKQYRRLLLIDNLSSLLLNEQIILFLDGLDELGEDRLRFLRDWLAKSHVRSILTCRTGNFIGARKVDLPTFQIQPLGTEQVSRFAEVYLGATRAEIFLSELEETERSSGISKTHSLAQLARTPFFLMLMLANYAERQEYTPRPWHLLKNIVEVLWQSERVKELLGKYDLISLADPESIIDFLSEIVSHQLDFAGSYYEAKQRLGTDLAKVLVEAGIIEDITNWIRFRHPLIEDFFVANKLAQSSDLDRFASHSELCGALVILAGRDEPTRTRVQQSLVKSLDIEGVRIDSSDGPIWALGEIGDSTVIAPLLALYGRTGANSILKPLARIADRSQDKSNEKSSVVQTIEKAIEKALSDGLAVDPEEPRSIRNIPSFRKLVEIALVVETLGEIKSEDAAQALLRSLSSFLTLYKEHLDMFPPMFKTFSRGFSDIGEPALPIMFQAAESKNSRVASVASEALGYLRHSMPLPPLFHLLATNPNSLVRHHTAIKLGQLKNQDAIPHLIAALNDDGIWSQGTNNALLDTRARYFYVADSAAYALSQFESETAVDALRRHQYMTDGRPSLGLLISRLESGRDLDSEWSLRTHWARMIWTRPNGLEALLPLMGHLESESGRLDPIAKAFIHSSKRRSEEPPIPQLLSYLESSSDPGSKKWALVVLGEAGNFELVSLLHSYARGEKELSLRAAGTWAWGALISRHMDEVSNLELVVDELISLLDSAEPEAYSGIGVGLSRIAQACIKEESEITDKIITELVKRIDGNVSSTKLAIDALDSVFLGIASVRDISEEDLRLEQVNLGRYLDEEVVHDLERIITASPTLEMKFGASHLIETRYGETEPEEAINAFRKVLDTKHQMKPEWSVNFSESDWQDIRCDDGRIYCLAGRALYHQKKWQDASASYGLGIEKMGELGPIDRDYKLLLAQSLSDLGYLQESVMGRQEEAKTSYIRAMEIARSMNDTNLLISVLSRAQSLSKDLEDWKEVLAYGTEIVELTHGKITRRQQDARATLLMCQAHLKQGDLGTAMQSLVTLQSEATSLGERDILAGVLIQKIALNYQARKIGITEEDIQAIKGIYTSIQDWSSTSFILDDTANVVVEFDKNRGRELYEESLIYINRVQADDPQYRTFKAMLMNRLAQIYSEEGKYDQAETYYWQSLNILRESEMQHALAAVMENFGKFLFYKRGNSEDGIRFVTESLSIQRKLGIDPSSTVDLLYEMNTNPEWHLPSPIVSMVGLSIAAALTYEPEKKGYWFKYVSDLREYAESEDWQADIEFLSVLQALLNGQEATLSKDNIYYEPFNRIQTAVSKFNFFEKVIDETAKIVVDAPNRISSWKSQLSQYLVEAHINGDTDMASILAGLIAFLQGVPPENAKAQIGEEAFRAIEELEKRIQHRQSYHSA